MKNFYELLDIKKEINICLRIYPVIDIQFPKIKININDNCVYDNLLKERVLLQHKIELLEGLSLKIELYGKNYKNFQKLGIVIESIKINSFEIIPSWTHLAVYENDKNVSHPTNYLGFNGIWNLEINEPFYRWRHRITGQGWLLEP